MKADKNNVHASQSDEEIGAIVADLYVVFASLWRKHASPARNSAQKSAGS